MKDLDWLGVKFKKRERKRRKVAPKKYKSKYSCYVGSNIEKMWWGNEAMTPNLWRDK